MLHNAIQVVVGWTDEPLHQFTFRGVGPTVAGFAVQYFGGYGSAFALGATQGAASRQRSRGISLDNTSDTGYFVHMTKRTLELYSDAK
ncbi:hypothetical protein [Cupriavidus sp. D39]|uniref:hypothetical protein n=1 Tax=Cupriavidus sp. D39 TaxID=2997877 RepID=UPI00226EFA8D|nr:hypothetical protein [Cupriavidus sp. D39]MCY0852928.1 hypothetical protein [Cupriavidus sp. D39]